MKYEKDILDAAKILIDAHRSRIGDPMSLAVVCFNQMVYRDITTSEGWLLKTLLDLATATSSESHSLHYYIEATSSVAKLGASADGAPCLIRYPKTHK